MKAAGIVAAARVGAALILGMASKVGYASSGVSVATGGLVSVQVWKYPVEASSNEGSTYTDGRRGL